MFAASHDAIERGDDLLIGLLLAQHQQLGLLRLDGGVISLLCLLLSRIGQAIGVALLLGDPALPHQNRVAPPSDPGQFTGRLGLAMGGFGLRQIGLGLGDLVVELRGGDRRQQVARLHLRADIDIALGDISAGAGIDVGGFEGVGGGRQGHAHRAGARPHRFDADGRDEIAMLLRGGGRPRGAARSVAKRRAPGRQGAAIARRGRAAVDRNDCGERARRSAAEYPGSAPDTRARDCRGRSFKAPPQRRPARVCRHCACAAWRRGRAR